MIGVTKLPKSRLSVLVFVLVFVGYVRLHAAEGAANTDALIGHFPDRAHAVVWRNWHAVEPSRIADVLGTSEQNVTAMAESMGLPSARAIPPQQKTRGYFWMTLCRRNWHLLPIDQLARLLDTTPEKLQHFLQVEEIANWYILGGFKPACSPVKYAPPDAKAQQRAAEIKDVVHEYFGDELREPGEPRFAFMTRFRQARPATPNRSAENRSESSPRFLCSCLRVYGDPLMDPEVDMYPEGLLQRLADVGVNGVWLYGVLQDLAPGGTDFPEFGKNHETRQANLRTLVRRAKRYGIGVYLYINEPRAKPPAFFAIAPIWPERRRKRANVACVRRTRWSADGWATRWLICSPRSPTSPARSRSRHPRTEATALGPENVPR